MLLGVDSLEGDRNFSFVLSRSRLTQDQILGEVKSGELFGVLEIDIHTPDYLKERFKDFQPIIKHSQITIDDVSIKNTLHCHILIQL